MIKKAFIIAEREHAEAMYGDRPYIYHLRQTYEIAKFLGVEDVDILCACILHDILEDTDYTYEMMVEDFNERVAMIVFRVTDEEGDNRKERKAKTYIKTRTMWESILVKLCDRIANVKSAIEDGNSLRKMYLKEMDTFYSELYKDDNNEIVEKAWTELKNLLYGN